jgi:hypothetical protein
MPGNQGKNEACFSDARWALFWSADVLRRRYLPKIGAFWRESAAEPSDGADVDLSRLAEGVGRRVEKNYLPEDAEERHGLALKVEEILARLGEEGVLLRQLAWGDGWCDASWRAALAHRELARRQGMKIRVSYRYTYRQMAALHDCDAKAVWRRARVALAAFTAALEQAGLLWRPEAPVAAVPVRKALKARAFKPAA